MEKQNIIVDENYPGLVDDGWCFSIKGALVTKGSISITLKKWFWVEKGIKAGGGIEAGGGIKAGGGIEAGWGIEAG